MTVLCGTEVARFKRLPDLPRDRGQNNREQDHKRN
jgi:hypothetical protein